MSAAQVTNLSLLSRGVGEVQIQGHEKIEVKLEPEVCIAEHLAYFLRKTFFNTV